MRYFLTFFLGFAVASVVIPTRSYFKAMEFESQIAVDGYVFEGKEWLPEQSWPIQFVLYPDIDTLNELAPSGVKVQLRENNMSGGWMVNNSSTGKCEIHIVAPERTYTPANIGHEVTHCLYGNFHPSADK